MLEQFPNDVKLVFKNFPLPNHPFARKAAAAALAAGRQGQFWPFHDKVFENYNSLDDKKLDAFAKELGLDLDRFAKDRQDPAIQRLIQRDLTEGRRLGVRGTPTVLVNGRVIRNRSLSGLAAVVRKELENLARSNP